SDLQALDLRVHIHGPYVYSGFISLNGNSYVDVPSYAASVNKSVQISVDDPSFANPIPARIASSGTTWSVAIPTPAIGKHPICCSPVGPPVAGEPAPVNMAYFGGHVQVTPKIYLVFWGWGQAGAFDHTTPGMPTYDPDGAAQRMTDFVKAMGGTDWAGVQTQYYE